VAWPRIASEVLSGRSHQYRLCGWGSKKKGEDGRKGRAAQLGNSLATYHSINLGTRLGWTILDLYHLLDLPLQDLRMKGEDGERGGGNHDLHYSFSISLEIHLRRSILFRNQKGNALGGEKEKATSKDQ